MKIAYRHTKKVQLRIKALDATKNQRKILLTDKTTRGIITSPSVHACNNNNFSSQSKNTTAIFCWATFLRRLLNKSHTRLWERGRVPLNKHNTQPRIKHKPTDSINRLIINPLETVQRVLGPQAKLLVNMFIRQSLIDNLISRSPFIKAIVTWRT